MSEVELVEWARGILSAQMRQVETARRKCLKPSPSAEQLHKLRTRARRLRSALEDLRHCTPKAAKCLSVIARLGDRTGKARDGQVLLARLRRYRCIATPAERAQIDRLLNIYKKRSNKWDDVANDAIREFSASEELL